MWAVSQPSFLGKPSLNVFREGSAFRLWSAYSPTRRVCVLGEVPSPTVDCFPLCYN